MYRYYHFYIDLCWNLSAFLWIKCETHLRLFSFHKKRAAAFWYLSCCARNIPNVLGQLDAKTGSSRRAQISACIRGASVDQVDALRPPDPLMSDHQQAILAGKTAFNRTSPWAEPGSNRVRTDGWLTGRRESRREGQNVLCNLEGLHERETYSRPPSQQVRQWCAGTGNWSTSATLWDSWRPSEFLPP